MTKVYKRSKAREYLESTREMVLNIFDSRCIMCGKYTREVHEIIPISHGRFAWAVKNRVPLCGFPSDSSCHEWAHRVGTRNSIPILQQKRGEFLRNKWKMKNNLQ